MSAPRPVWPADDAPSVAALEVDWAALRDDWRAVPWRLATRGETWSGHANRIRAQVAEDIAPVRALAFAGWLEERRS